MNDSQTLLNTGGSELNQTQSLQQAKPSQNLGAPQSGLQNTNTLSLNQQDLKITNVSSTGPVTSQASTVSSDNTPNSSVYPLISGTVIALALVIGLAFWAIKKSRTNTVSTEDNLPDSAKLLTENAYVKTRKRKQSRSKRKRSTAR